MLWTWVILLALAGAAAGYFAVANLLRRDGGLAASIAPAASVAVLGPLVFGQLEVAPPLLALGVALGGSALGWTVASFTLMPEPDRTARRVSKLPADAPRRPAVVYFTHGEPSVYDPEPWVNMLYELKATVPSFPPKPVWPFVLLGIKRSFKAVGHSPHGSIHAETMRKVEQALGRDDVSFHLSFLDADPPLRDATYEAVETGATDIVFLTVFLTDSDHTAEADDMDEAMGLSEAGLRVVRTPVLWNDPRLARMMADKIARAVGDRDRGHVGVILVGHGQPHEWDATHPTETEQEQAFRAAVREVLVGDGFRPELVSDGWMSFRDPKVPGRVRELIDAGATTIVGVPVTISADSLHSLHDTPELVRKGAKGREVEIIDVGAWNDEDLLVEILADRARDALAELASRN